MQIVVRVSKRQCMHTVYIPPRDGQRLHLKIRLTQSGETGRRAIRGMLGSWCCNWDRRVGTTKHRYVRSFNTKNRQLKHQLRSQVRALSFQLAQRKNRRLKTTTTQCNIAAKSSQAAALVLTKIPQSWKSSSGWTPFGWCPRNVRLN